MQQKIGPYRVEERIGTGGMGEVYKAYDDRLDRWVAIKRIRGDRDEAAENRERFQREARATAQLNHSSIVHLYDIFQDGDSDCIVMEYVEGMTLDKLIRNGPLEPLQVASLGHEIATGLSEAHAKGIIHRDLKVENVIVTPKGHAKILDFGLARPLLKSELDTSLTGKGQLVGTSRTMSPEYVSGEDIDHRSDLFSLGVLLYEAVTSHSPFKAHNTLATLKQVMLHRQTPAHQVNSHVPEDLSAVIESLLEKDPDDRPQSAEEVAQEFGRIAGRLSSGDVDRPPISSSFSSTPTEEVFTPSATAVDLWLRRRSLMSILALLAVGVAATFFLTRWLVSDPVPLPVPGGTEPLTLNVRDRIVLADFQNHTAEPILDSLELAFRLGLEQSRAVLPRSQMQGALSRMKLDPSTKVDRELGIEICQREDAKVLVIGSIVKIGETYSLSAEIVEPRDGVTTFSTRENASDKNAIFDALDIVTKEIRVHLGESLLAIERNQQPLEKVTTGNLEALKAYSLGVTKGLEGKSEAAIQLLERALELDSDFAMAHAKLATIYLNLDLDRTKALKHLDEALRLSDRLTEVEKLYVDGWVARLHGDPNEVIEAWTLMSSLYPDEIIGQYNLGTARLFYLEQYEAAAQAFKAAARVAAPKDLSQALVSLSFCQTALGQYEESKASLDQASGPGKTLALAQLYIAMGNSSAARRVLAEHLSEFPRFRQIQGRLTFAESYAGEGKLEEAIKEAHEAQRLATEEGSLQLRLASQLTLAALRERLGPEPALREIITAATREVKEQVGINYENLQRLQVPIPILALIGKLDARNGEVDGAEMLFAAISSSSKGDLPAAWQAYLDILEGELLLARGDPAEALESLQKALSLTDSFQAHESLARALIAANQHESAVSEYEWLVNHRGRGVMECTGRCQGLGVIDWTLAFYHLGQLHEQGAEVERAIDNYRRFIEVWQMVGEDLEIWQDATRRLAALEAPAG